MAQTTTLPVAKTVRTAGLANLKQSVYAAGESRGLSLTTTPGDRLNGLQLKGTSIEPAGAAQ